jgi:hypothetical protein
MTAREYVLWHNEVTEGFFDKSVVETQKITTYRVYQNSAYIALSELDDIVIMNEHRVSQSDYSSFSSGRDYSTGFGTSKSRSKTIGDLVFICRGTPRIIFKHIPYPQGIARLAKVARKRVIEDMQRSVKISKAQLQQQQQQQQQQQKERSNKRVRTSGNKGITCALCSSTDSEGFEYCSNCGFSLAQKRLRKSNRRRIRQDLIYHPHIEL